MSAKLWQWIVLFPVHQLVVDHLAHIARSFGMVLNRHNMQI